MSKGKLNLQAADGAVIGLVVPDGLTSGERQIALGVNLSGITAYHLLQGNLSVSNEVLTNGFSTTLYTGTGASQSINTGVDMNTQWGNDASEKFGGLVWGKSRSNAISNCLFDTARGALNRIESNATSAQVASTGVSSFTSTGFSLGATTDLNTNTATYASWNFQTTHRVTGTTNHGKAYTCHFNPFTGFTIVKYEGSGLVGHEIPHHLGRKLDFVAIKNLNTANGWLNYSGDSTKYMQFNTTAPLTAVTGDYSDFNSYNSILGATGATNGSTNQHVMYGWANSYYDEADKLIGNYEIGVYQGTGVAGNKVKTKGKPAWVMIKRTDSTGNWVVFDNQRGNSDYHLYPNLSNAEGQSAGYGTDFYNDGFAPAISGTPTWVDTNASGGQYLYMVAYDTNSNGGGSYYPLASDTANVQINNALIPLAQGIDSNGTKNTILSKNETITGLTYTQGKNYVYCDKNGAYGRMSIAPNYGKVNPANGGDFYNVITNKWFTSAGVEITNSRNYLNHIVHADNDGGILYVEELPKIEYKDIVKANEFKGKNACTALISFDGTTTPITIRDSYNVSAIIRVATGVFDIYFEEQMDNTGYSIAGTGQYYDVESPLLNRYLNKVQITTGVASSTRYNDPGTTVIIMGGKN